jgi:hypothetical protein
MERQYSGAERDLRDGYVQKNICISGHDNSRDQTLLISFNQQLFDHLA